MSPNGPEVSRLSYGTWRMLDDESRPSAEEVAARLNRCVELGITTIDTAEIYGVYSVEAALGEALRLDSSLRDRIEIVTKAGIDIPSDQKSHARVNHYNATAENLIACAERSLQLMATDYLDVFLVHRPDWLTAAEETAEGLFQLVKSGKVRHAGVSNYTASQFATLSSFVDEPLVTNQIETSLLHMDALYDGTLDQCQEYEICPMGWSPMAGGRLFDQSLEPTQRLSKLASNELAEKYGLDLGQLAYAWLLAHPSNIVPVIGTNRLERIDSAAAACNVSLERQDWYALWEAAKGQSVP